MKTERFQIVLAPSEREAVKEWRFTHRISSESEAIRQLVKLGMEAAAGGGMPWQPIAMAPKDGRSVLLYEASASGGRFMIGKWEPLAGAWIDATAPESANAAAMLRPTHWMPLAAPASA